MKKKICVITGSRAEYGLLRNLMFLIRRSKQHSLQLIATGMHLSKKYGHTYKEIEKDGFKINKKVKIFENSNLPLEITKSIGNGVIFLARALNELKPDLVILVGDRSEILSAAIASYYTKTLTAHIHGGETTLGSLDDNARHCITKLSSIHFTATKEFKKRVIQLGENPKRVFNVGGLGVDKILSSRLLTKRQLEKKINFKFAKENYLITFHPEILGIAKQAIYLKKIFNFLSKFKNKQFIFTMPNSDQGNHSIKGVIKQFVKNNKKKSIFFESMGSKLYLSTMKQVSAVIGNSSSGITEAPTFKVPTINVGNRQKGRPQSRSIINCSYELTSFVKAIKRLSSKRYINNLNKTKNPYGNSLSSKKIFRVIRTIISDKKKIKNFYDLKNNFRL